jgi:type I restriction enzyme S subunit
VQQQVPEGYQQTEVGVIPDDWSVDVIKEAYDICNTLRLPISSKIREGMKGKYPYYGPTRIQDYINEYRVEGEYALIGEDGDHFLKYERMPQTQMAKGRFNVNNHAHLIKGNKNLTEWFYFYFRNRDISLYLTRQGAGRFKLSKGSLEKLPCALPPAGEQKEVVSVLSDVDALITSLEKLIAKKRAIKTAAMQQLLTGKKRLPPFDQAHTGYKQTELGQIPEDWEVVTLNNLCPIMTGNTPSTNKPEYYGEEHLFVSPADMQGQKYISNTGKKLSKKGFAICRQYPKASILFTCIGSTIGKSGIAGEQLTSNQQINAVLPSDKIDMEYVYYQLLYTAPVVKQQAGEQAVPIVNKTQFGEHLVLVPSNQNEQKVISILLSDMDSELAVLEQRLNKTQQLKQGMMQELLTGRTRLV